MARHACTPYRQTASIDQFDRLGVVTLAPLATLVVMWIAHAVMPAVVSWKVKSPMERILRVAKYRLVLYRSALFMLFTIYPGLSTEIVKTFRYWTVCM
jgi:hypothetical protein